MNTINANQYPSKSAYETAVLGASLAEQIVNAVNGHSEKDLLSGFARQLECSHRTLQASTVRLLMGALIKYAQDVDANDCTDLRNEAAIKLLLKLQTVVKDNHIPFI